MNVTVFSKRGALRGIAGRLLMLTLISACSTATKDYVHPKYDFSLIQKIGVLPLENLSQDQQAGEKVRKIVVSELLAAGELDVIEPAQVNQALGQQQIQNISGVSAKQITDLGKSLGVQAFIVGSVDTYERVNVGGGTFAEVAITLRALDATSGAIVWSTSKSAGGAGFFGRLFGFGGDTMYEATQRAVHNAVVTLFQ
jgi:hypothetical protein